MDRRQRTARRRRGDRDRLSKLGDGVLGHILSFLDTKQAARAAVLSRRWRNILANVHTVTLEQPEPPLPDYDSDDRSRHNPHQPPLPFSPVVTTALLARRRRQDPATVVPLRALRVALESYSGSDGDMVDEWIADALMYPAPKLELDLCFVRAPVCSRPDPRRRRLPVRARRADNSGDEDADDVASCANDLADEEDDAASCPDALANEDDDVASSADALVDTSRDMMDANEEDDVGSSADESVPAWWELPPPVYTVPRHLFSCCVLRSLRLGSCRLRLPETISLPSLEELRLTHVRDKEERVQSLISACQNLADLTLEACTNVTALSLLDNERLRKLALRCCPKLSSVTVHASELHCFDYCGTIPDKSFLILHGDAVSGFPSIITCKIDVCAVCVAQEAMSEEQLAKLNSFMGLFLSAKQLHLCAAHMSSCFVNLPAFTSVTHLHLNGRVRHDDNADVATKTSAILKLVPNLEVLTLFFEAGPHEAELKKYGLYTDEELYHAHHLHYQEHDNLDSAESVPIPQCLRSKMRSINLLHYQGGRAQKTLARFLLRNAPHLEELYCKFAEGPWWTLTELTREMKGWVINEGASKVFG